MADEVDPSDSSRTAVTTSDGPDRSGRWDEPLRAPSWSEKGRLSSPAARRRRSSERRRSLTRLPEKKWGFQLRPWDDEAEADWWFAGTAIP